MQDKFGHMETLTWHSPPNVADKEICQGIPHSKILRDRNGDKYFGTKTKVTIFKATKSIFSLLEWYSSFLGSAHGILKTLGIIQNIFSFYLPTDSVTRNSFAVLPTVNLDNKCFY